MLDKIKNIFRKEETDETEEPEAFLPTEADEIEIPDTRYTPEYENFVAGLNEDTEEEIDPFADLAAMEEEDTEVPEPEKKEELFPGERDPFADIDAMENDSGE